MAAKISILMGIYNCAETLPEAIDSILAQTYTDWELILCDDDAYVPELLGALRRYHLNHEKLVTHSLPLYTVGITAPAGILLDSEDEKEKASKN